MSVERSVTGARRLTGRGVRSRSAACAGDMLRVPAREGGTRACRRRVSAMTPDTAWFSARSVAPDAYCEEGLAAHVVSTPATKRRNR